MAGVFRRLSPMVDALLSVFLMGLLPVAGVQGEPQNTLGANLLSVSAPAQLEEPGAQSLLELQQRLSASGVLIVDLDSGQPLFRRAADVPRPMASLTKLMTALVIVEHHDMGEWVTIPEDITSIEGSKADLHPGDQYTVGDLLSAMLILSANDAAETLARYHSGNEKSFVKEMNDRAAVLGLKETMYMNADGIDAKGQKMSPQDLAWLTMFVLKYPDIRVRMGTPEATIQSKGGHLISLRHTHELLHEDSPVIAGKTGTTDGAGQCLLSVVQEGGKRYLVILLHSFNRYADMRAVLQVLRV